jgi:hypothetical protein
MQRQPPQYGVFPTLIGYMQQKYAFMEMKASRAEAAYACHITANEQRKQLSGS